MMDLLDIVVSIRGLITRGASLAIMEHHDEITPATIVRINQLCEQDRQCHRHHIEMALKPATAEQYDCTTCGKRFPRASNDEWSEEKADKEYRRNFGYDTSPRATVCEACYYNAHIKNYGQWQKMTGGASGDN